MAADPGIPLQVVLDPWVQDRAPAVVQPRYPDQFARRLVLDAMLSAAIIRPSDLITLTSCGGSS